MQRVCGSDNSVLSVIANRVLFMSTGRCCILVLEKMLLLYYYFKCFAQIFRNKET